MADLAKHLGVYNGPGPKTLYKDIGNGYYAEIVATVSVAGDSEEPVTSSNPYPIAGPVTRVLRVNPTVTATPDYSVNDVIGGKILIDGLARKVGNGGVLNSVLLTSKVDLPSGTAIDILFFDTDPTASTFTDNVAFSLNEADIPRLLPGIAQLSTKISLGTGAALTAQNLGIPLKTSTTDDIWAVAVVRAGTVNLASTSDIQIVFGFLPD